MLSLTRWARPIRVRRSLAAIATVALVFVWIWPSARAQGSEQISSYDKVFGVTEKWAKTFEALGVPADTGWYVSRGPFSYLAFGHAMDGFSVSAAGTISATPASSGSSGFSGGGFGGGGGGSW